MPEEEEMTVPEPEAVRGTQRKYLRGLAHSLKPVVQVGHEGLSEALLAAVVQALNDHELIKVRFGDHKTERRELSRQMADSVGADLVGLIGHVAILYRPAENPEDRKIVLP